MIGVSYGAPTEFRRTAGSSRATDRRGGPSSVRNAIDQDDLYVEMTFAEVMDTRRPRRPRASSTARCSRTRSTSSGTPTPARGACSTTASRRRMSGAPRSTTSTPNDIDFQIESDFIGLMSPGPAARGQQVRRPRGPRHELRRRPLRRHVLRGDVRGGLLRERSAQGRGGRPALDPRGQRLRTDHPRRARLVARGTRPTGRRPGSSSPTSGTRTTPAPTARCAPFNIDARLNGAFVALGPALRRRRLREDARRLDARRPGLGLQPFERGSGCWA